MKELKKKTFLTICGILTVILIISLALINIQNYNRERENIVRILRVFDDPENPAGRLGPFELQRGKQAPDPGESPAQQPGDFMIPDHEVYTVYLKDGRIDRIISHGNSSEDFDIEALAGSILQNSASEHESIGNLYFSAYAYLYKAGESLVVINLKELSAKLRRFLLISLLLFVLLEAAVVFLSRLIARWIVFPAAEAFQKQKDFIADASHELKTPLAVILASADELGADGIQEDRKNVYIENIRHESERMNRLILGLLELSRLEDADLKSSYREEDLSRLIEKTALIFEGVAFEQRVGIETDIEDGIRFSCSRDEIEKMLSTILDNAVKHSDPDTAISIRARKNKGRITIRITNKGTPIPPEDTERIFERFYRVDKARNRAENRYGLGLAIARTIAANHNGNIRAFSENGETSFEITLTE
ncbi:MAG: HAMP domain-containing histidine kinase [Lachnospiraceae bacterium]|nr:HAMP domain-containing histidine kinase [Lachnospiraceae bacterium]